MSYLGRPTTRAIVSRYTRHCSSSSLLFRHVHSFQTVSRDTARRWASQSPGHQGQPSGLDLAVAVPTLVNLVELAGQAIRDIAHERDVTDNTTQSSQDKSNVYTSKRDNSPVTSADYMAHAIITKGLQRILPADLRVVSEEDISAVDAEKNNDPIPSEYQSRIDDIIASKGSYDSGSPALAECIGTWPVVAAPSDMYMVVDPLDGTWEFIAGRLDAVTVMAGIVVKGQPVFGVIHQPFPHAVTVVGSPSSETVMRRALLSGAVDPEHWTSLSLQDYGDPQGRWITTRNHRSKAMEAVFDHALQNNLATAIEPQGGAGNKFLQLLQGAADAYVLPLSATRIWDTCAGDAILRAAHGKVTTAGGDALVYPLQVPLHPPRSHEEVAAARFQHKNRGGLVASAPGQGERHDAIVHGLQEAIPDDISK
eukprot:TRINITY_DN40790_c0_g1_i1.p1 TRINITY_DN40790_c0_g1~~TRINITY_DN40790_c0_g1_i1.p1  ORF type:complete len:423 (+),score=29.68 TRINITY_DN40790_c0_g1_i1:224-1492(+)